MTGEVKHGQGFVLTRETVKDSASMWSMLHLVLVIVKALVSLAFATKIVEHFVHDHKFPP